MAQCDYTIAVQRVTENLFQGGNGNSWRVFAEQVLEVSLDKIPTSQRAILQREAFDHATISGRALSLFRLFQSECELDQGVLWTGASAVSSVGEQDKGEDREGCGAGVQKAAFEHDQGELTECVPQRTGSDLGVGVG